MENIPKKFEMGNLYTAWLFEEQADGNFKWTCIRNECGPTGLSKTEQRSVVEDWIEKETFKITKIYEEEKPVANGVDAEGKAMNFTPDMLEPFMRVKIRKGQYAIIVTGNKGNVLCFDDATWTEVEFEPESESDLYVIDEVWRHPSEPWLMITPANCGKLIWKRQEIKPVGESITKRLEWLQVHIDAVKENMESLQAEYNELKQAVK